MHKSATKCNETLGKWCKNKHGASKIIDTLETYHGLNVAWWTIGPLPVVTFTTGTSTVSAALSKNIHYALSWSLFHSNYYRASRTNTSSKGNLCPCLSSHRRLSPNTKNWRYICTCSNEHIVLLNLKHGGRGSICPPHREWIRCSPRYLHTPFQIFIQEILTYF
jgi:hypothetical protein